MASETSMDSLGETLIPIVTKLQEILHGANLPEECKIQLPEVAVVGSQSSGKSSVLESLVGRDFLPRGTGICTRRPLILHLRRTSEAEDGAREWAEFNLHLPGKRFTDFTLVRQEIDAETTRLLGSSNKDVSDNPIHLTIYSPHVVTMSLVDLPGMTRVPVAGQPDDISHKLEALIMTYISNPNCIILAVSAANSDLATSDAIALARSVDPNGSRTIGVLTKLDIMDHGTDALAMLRNEVLPLSLGYVGVVNRSQQDIHQKKTVAAARKDETDFFATHPVYSQVADLCGVSALNSRIKSVLVRHIRARLPELKRLVEQKVQQQSSELLALGKSMVDASAEARRSLLLRVMQTYAAAVSDVLRGRRSRDVAAACALHGGARIRHVFQQIYCKALRELEPCGGMTDEQIWATMNNCAGVSVDVVLSRDAFEVLVRASMRQFLKPGLQCLSLVTNELLRIAEDCRPRELGRFPILDDRLGSLVRSHIEAAASSARVMLTNLFECELAYINVDHPSFIGLENAFREHLSAARSATGGAADGHANNHHAHHAHHANNHAHLRDDSHDAPDGAAARHESAHFAHHSITHPRSRSATTVRHHAALMAGTDSHMPPTDSAPDLAHADDNAPSGSSWFGGLFKRGGGADVAHDQMPGPGPSNFGFGSILAATSAQPSGNGRARREGPNLPLPPSELVSTISSPEERDMVQLMRRLITSYFAIVRSNLSDLVPKIIMKFLVLHTESSLHAHLVTSLLKEREHELLRERPEVELKRKTTMRALGVLSQALRQLQLMPKELEDDALGSSNALDAEAGNGLSSGDLANLGEYRGADLDTSLELSAAMAKQSLAVYTQANVSVDDVQER